MDEKKQGTLELLFTKPLSMWQIVNGKFLGAFFLIVVALIPTLIYVWIVSYFGNPQGNIDIGSTMGSYFGLLFLASTYCAIGVFTSTLSENQIVAFIVAVFICFVFYFGFESIGDLFNQNNGFISKLGMDYHFKSMSRGVIDTRDVIYFSSVTLFFFSFDCFPT